MVVLLHSMSIISRILCLYLAANSRLTSGQICELAYIICNHLHIE